MNNRRQFLRNTSLAGLALSTAVIPHRQIAEVASVKIGKMKDRIKMIGEGYMLVDGTLTLRELTNEKLVFSIKGDVGKYSDFQQPDKLYPVEGWIVYKKPDMHFENITEAEIIKNEKVK